MYNKIINYDKEFEDIDYDDAEINKLLHDEMHLQQFEMDCSLKKMHLKLF